MSSSYIRSEIKSFLSANSTEKFVDLTAEIDEMQELLDRYSIKASDSWVGIQYIGSEELPITIQSNGTVGRYRETGSIYIHVVAPSKFGVANVILPRVEVLRNLLRGKRIGDIIIESVTPPNFEFGAALQFEGGYTSGSFICNYERDYNL